MSCEEIFSQESGLVCKKTIEIVRLEKLLERIAGMCGNPNASDGCRDILKLYKEYLTKYKVKE